jgi:5'(3')-deoxyribonucleotidase
MLPLELHGASTLIKLDVDGVLRNWNASLIREAKLTYPGIVIRYPFENFNIAPSFPAGFDNRQFYLEERPDAVYTNADAYDGAVEFVNALLMLCPHVWLVTTQYPKTMYPTIQWIEAHLPASDVPVVFSKEKGLIGKQRFAHTILIDDAPHNLDNQVKHGGDAYCFGQAYNTPEHDPEHKWMHFRGTELYSLEDEPRRIRQQYAQILELLRSRLY